MWRKGEKWDSDEIHDRYDGGDRDEGSDLMILAMLCTRSFEELTTLKVPQARMKSFADRRSQGDERSLCASVMIVLRCFPKKTASFSTYILELDRKG